MPAIIDDENLAGIFAIERMGLSGAGYKIRKNLGRVATGKLESAPVMV